MGTGNRLLTVGAVSKVEKGRKQRTLWSQPRLETTASSVATMYAAFLQNGSPSTKQAVCCADKHARTSGLGVDPPHSLKLPGLLESSLVHPGMENMPWLSWITLWYQKARKNVSKGHGNQAEGLPNG